MAQVLYTGYFVNDSEKLLSLIPVSLKGSDLMIYAHHVTVEYMPKNGIDTLDIGERRILLAYGIAKNESVEAILIKSDDDTPISKNKYPHITMATANDARPSESNALIENAIINETVEYFSSPIEIDTTLGYFDGKDVVIH